jgi:hypothetical protein
MAIIEIKNKDKIGHGADVKNPKFMPYSPSVLIWAGKKNSGKGVAVKNIIGRAEPPYDVIKIWHIDEKTLEWDDCGEIITELPEYDSWDRKKKNLFIWDETNFVGMNKEMRGKCDRYCQYMSTHYQITICILNQDFISIPTTLRRCADWWCLWPSVDHESMSCVSRKTSHSMKQLAKQFCKTKWDFIVFDHSGNGPKLRVNIFDAIDIEESDSE